MTDRVPRSTLLLAGALDQLVLLGTFLLGLGAGLLVADNGDGSGAAVGVGILGGILGGALWFVVQLWLAVRLGTTAGLFLLGLRFEPGTPVHWFEDAVDWLLSFWRTLVLLPLVWVVGKVSGRDGAGPRTRFVPDARSRTGGGRAGRALLALCVLASPVPLVLAVLA